MHFLFEGIMGQKNAIKAENDTVKIIVTIILAFITIAIFFLYRRRKAARRGILLTGLCDSGKTVLFTQIIHNKFMNTQTSIKENIGIFITEAGPLKVVDIPGHERVRNKFLEKYKPTARGVVYVIDSVTVQQNIKDAAEFLYDILSDPVFTNNSMSVLILCNKQDLTLAKSSKAVKAMLEKELNTLKITKSSQLESVDPKTKKSSILGGEGKEFSFSHLNSVKVEFAESSAQSDSIDLDQLKKWLIKIA